MKNHNCASFNQKFGLLNDLVAYQQYEERKGVKDKTICLLSSSVVSIL